MLKRFRSKNKKSKTPPSDNNSESTTAPSNKDTNTNYNSTTSSSSATSSNQSRQLPQHNTQTPASPLSTSVDYSHSNSTAAHSSKTSNPTSVSSAIPKINNPNTSVTSATMNDPNRQAPQAQPSAAALQAEQSNMNIGSLISMHERVRPRNNIFATPIDFSSDYVTPSYVKTESAIQFIDNSLADNFIFASLTSDERRSLIDAMDMDAVSAGTIIIQQGDIGDYFYVVEEGTVSFSVDRNHVGSCSKGASFGELALLYNCPRAATCVANTDCRLWRVDQKTFRYMLANNTANQQKDILDVLRKVPFLCKLEDSTLVRISDALTTVCYPEGEQIIKKGDTGEVFYILREGQVKVHDIGTGDCQYVDQFLSPGDWFGERALLTGEPRIANCTATTACSTLCLSRQTFENTLGPLQDLIDHAAKKRVLMGVPIFANSHLQPYDMTRLTDLLKEVVYEAGTLLAEEGQPANRSLFIIRQGKVVIANDNGMINELGPGDYFGETAIQEDENTISHQTIRVREESVCGVLSQESIERVIGNVKRLGKPLPPVASKLDRTIRLKDMSKVRILGVGTFGKVWLVSHKRTHKPYALKMLNKREIIGHHQVEGVIREKNIMSSIDHPFVVNLVCTFQDDRSLYMLIELVQGGELFSVIHTETSDGIPNEIARFYAACILESLSHLHQRHICYRDLKPENILIDSKGYGVLVDLGFAKIVHDKTYTLCGTPEYLAPEIILSKGHDKGVDYWAFGVLIYEMLVGRSPFYAYGSDQVSLFKRIVQVKFGFPPNLLTPEAEDMITHLIVRRQSNRFGCLARGDMDVRDHRWLSVINAEELLQKKVSAPWVPELTDPLDSSHFDSYRHVENEAPSQRAHLSLHQQELFRDF